MQHITIEGSARSRERVHERAAKWRTWVTLIADDGGREPTAERRRNMLGTKHTVRLQDNTIGKIDADSIDYLNPECFLGEMVNVHLNDENGNPLEVEGILAEVLESSYDPNFENPLR